MGTCKSIAGNQSRERRHEGNSGCLEAELNHDGTLASPDAQSLPPVLLRLGSLIDASSVSTVTLVFGAGVAIVPVTVVPSEA